MRTTRNEKSTAHPPQPSPQPWPQPSPLRPNRLARPTRRPPKMTEMCLKSNLRHGRPPTPHTTALTPTLAPALPAATPALTPARRRRTRRRRRRRRAKMNFDSKTLEMMRTTRNEKSTAHPPQASPQTWPQPSPLRPTEPKLPELLKEKLRRRPETTENE